jgi:hypothetical protein
LGIVDLGTGVFTQLGNMGLLLSGLGVSNGALYAGANATTTLYSVNPSNGSLTSIGSGTSTYSDTGSTLTGLYGLDPSFNLFSINASTGATTVIGPTGLSPASIFGLSTNSSTLYLTNGGSLYTIDTGTGTAHLVGALGTTNQVGAMVFLNGTLYGGDWVNHSIDTIDTTTGHATVGPTETGTSDTFWGLAPAAGVAPEPASLWLFGGGIATLALVRRRSRRN